MSMFLIKCHDLNNYLVHACEKLIDSMVKKMFETNSEEASQIINDVKRIQEMFTNKTDKSKELVQFEEYLKDVETRRKQEIHNRYGDLIEWVKLMYEYPQFEVGDDIYKTIKTAYSSVRRIAIQIEERSANLQIQRKEIEYKLYNESKDFANELNDLKVTIEGFREKTNYKQAVEFNATLDQLKEKLRQMTER